MIKVIKPGQDEFTTTCTKCGCVFSYTLSDLVNVLSPGYVYCPHCHNTCYHFPGFDSANDAYNLTNFNTMKEHKE